MNSPASAEHPTSASVTTFFRPWSTGHTFSSGDESFDKSSDASSVNRAVLSMARFTGHILAGTVIFLGIAAGAFLMGQVTHLLSERRLIPQLVLYPLTVIEYAIFIVDVTLFLIFTFRSTFEFLRSLFSDA